MTAAEDSVVNFHLFGEVTYDQAIRLQRRLVYEAASANSRQAVVILCEHPKVITIGRQGSRQHVRRTEAQLRREQLQIRWVDRGGGCLLHAPGQLAVYPVLSLAAFQWTAKQYAERLSRGLRQPLEELSIRTTLSDHGLWGQTGLLAALGVSIREQSAFHGVYLNVNPDMRPFRFVDAVAEAPPGQPRSMSCLLAERRLPVRMARVRSAIIASLSATFECARHHIHAGHPWLQPEGPSREPIPRAC